MGAGAPGAANSGGRRASRPAAGSKGAAARSTRARPAQLRPTKQAPHAWYLRKIRQLLCPPKPKELDSAKSMSAACFSLPTKMLRSAASSGLSRLRLGCRKPGKEGAEGRAGDEEAGKPQLGGAAAPQGWGAGSLRPEGERLW